MADGFFGAIGCNDNQMETPMTKRFVKHTIETAPEGSRERLRAQASKFGFLASPLATMAESPRLLEGALSLFDLFEHTSL